LDVTTVRCSGTISVISSHLTSIASRSASASRERVPSSIVPTPAISQSFRRPMEKCSERSIRTIP
jgi:hypothetical protein